MKRTLLLLPVTLAVASCQTDQAAEGRPPPDHRAIILQHKATLWKDPDSIKGAGISEPQLSMGIWHVCVRTNAKNSLGAYAGETDALIYVYQDGTPPRLIGDNAPYCARFPVTPFPELNGGYRPSKGAKT